MENPTPRSFVDEHFRRQASTPAKETFVESYNRRKKEAEEEELDEPHYDSRQDVRSAKDSGNAYPFANQWQERAQDNIDFLKDFAFRLEENFNNIDLDSLNPEQQDIIRRLKSDKKIQQYLREIAAIELASKAEFSSKEDIIAQKEREERLEEIAQDLFVIACASQLEMSEVIAFKDGILAREIISNPDSLLNGFRENVYGLSPLTAALAGGREIQDLELLIANGCDIHRKSPEGNNFAHFAVMFGLDEKYLQFAVDCGVDLNLRNRDNLTPLDLAMEMNREDLQKFLISKGAKSAQTKAELNAKQEEADSSDVSNDELSFSEAVRRQEGRGKEYGEEYQRQRSGKDNAKRARGVDQTKLEKIRQAMERSEARMAQDQMMMQLLLQQDEEEQRLKHKRLLQKQQEEFEQFFRSTQQTVVTAAPDTRASHEDGEAEKLRAGKTLDHNELIRQEIKRATGIELDSAQEINLDKMLFSAVSNGNNLLALLLMRLGGSVDYKENGETVLEVAIRRGGSIALIETLALDADPATVRLATEMLFHITNETLQHFLGMETTEKYDALLAELQELHELQQEQQLSREELERYIMLAEELQKILAEKKLVEEKIALGEQFEVAPTEGADYDSVTKGLDEKPQELEKEISDFEEDISLMDMIRLGAKMISSIAASLDEIADDEIETVIKEIEREKEMQIAAEASGAGDPSVESPESFIGFVSRIYDMYKSSYEAVAGLSTLEIMESDRTVSDREYVEQVDRANDSAVTSLISLEVLSSRMESIYRQMTRSDERVNPSAPPMEPPHDEFELPDRDAELALDIIRLAESERKRREQEEASSLEANSEDIEYDEEVLETKQPPSLTTLREKPIILDQQSLKQMVSY